MDTLAGLTERITTITDPAPLIKWIQDGGLEAINESVNKDILALLQYETTTTVSTLMDFVTLYKWAREHSNSIAIDALYKWTTEKPLVDFKTSLIDELSTIPCRLKILGDWKVQRLLASGAQGQVWEVTDAKSGNVAVMKRIEPASTNPDDEIEGLVDEVVASKRAAELGVGPAIYASGQCPILSDEKRVETYIIQQKLSGPTLGKIFPIPPAYFTHFMELYTIFVTETKWYNADVHLNNIMLDKDRLYMIDYGIIIAPAGPLEDELRKAAVKLLNSLVEQDTAWYYAADRKAALANFLELAEALSKWFYAKFPTAKQPLGDGGNLPDYRRFKLGKIRPKVPVPWTVYAKK